MRDYDPRDWYWRVTANPGFVFSSARGDFVPENDETYQAWASDGGHATRIATAQELGAVLSPHQVRPASTDVLDGYKDELARDIVMRPIFRVLFNHENRIRAIERALNLNGSPQNLTQAQAKAAVKLLM